MLPIVRKVTSRYWGCFQIGRPIAFFNNIRNFSGVERQRDLFPYTYELSDLLSNLQNSTKRAVIIPQNKQLEAIHLEELLKTALNEQIVSKNHVQIVVNLLLLLAKHGCNVEKIIKDSNEDFDRFLCSLNEHIEEMSADDLVSALIALQYSGVLLHHTANRALTLRVSRLLKDSTDFPLKTLSNLAIFSKQNRENIYPYFLCADGMLHIVRHLRGGHTSIENLYFITVYLNNFQKFLTKELMAEHTTKMEQLLCNINPKQFHKEIFTFLDFYARNMWYMNQEVIRSILTTMKNEIDSLSNEELQKLMHMNHGTIQAPVSSIVDIVNEAESRPNKSGDIHLIYCRLFKPVPDNSGHAMKDLLAFINRLDGKNILNNDTLYAALRANPYHSNNTLLKDVYHQYWHKVSRDISDALNGEVTLSFVCHQYYKLNRTSPIKYRSRNLESLLNELSLMEIKHEHFTWKSRQFAKLATFVITFSDVIPEYFMNKFEKMAPQFTTKEVMDICYSLNRVNGSGSKMNQKQADIISRLNNVMTKSIERLMDEGDLGIESLCLLSPTCVNQKELDRTDLQKKLAVKLEEACTSDDTVFTNHTVLFAATNLYKMSFAVPKLNDRLLRFVSENVDGVGSANVAKLLFYLFSVGYEPFEASKKQLLNNKQTDDELVNMKDGNMMLEQLSAVINRDFDLIPSWQLIQACLALSYFQVLATDLISRLFCVDFFTRLETELSALDPKCLPKNILTLVMELNRSVCLNNPEAGVPWFQQNFIESQLSAGPKSSIFNEDIYEKLLSYVGGEKSIIRTNHVTPYGYRIPFVVYFNSHKQLVMPPTGEGPQTLNKVAILPLHHRSFVEFNNKKWVRGLHRLQERHLNILGYDVIQICFHEWNLLLNSPGGHDNYLKQCFDKFRSIS